MEKSSEAPLIRKFSAPHLAPPCFVVDTVYSSPKRRDWPHQVVEIKADHPSSKTEHVRNGTQNVQVVPLRKAAPLLRRSIFKNSLPWLSHITFVWSLAGLAILLLWDVFAEAPAEFPSDPQIRVAAVWLASLVLLAAGRLGYDLVYLAMYDYDIDDENIVIRKGIFEKREITLPFTCVTDVYVDRDFLDLVFGLYDVHVSTPTQESGSFAHIDGVSRNSAEVIRKLVLSKINRITANGRRTEVPLEWRIAEMRQEEGREEEMRASY